MKNTFAVLLIYFSLISCRTSLLAQADTPIKYKAFHASMTVVEDGKIKTPFLKEMDISTLIVLNFSKDKIDIYSPREQHFDIIKYYDKDDSDPKFTTHRYQCVDSDGDKCDIFAIITAGAKNPDQLWVRYSETAMIYIMRVQKE
jgi:hypothetical protein